jgi:hypothetical protein
MRIKACANLDGNAGGQGLQFPGTSTPTQSVLYVEVSPVLDPKTTADNWVVLKQLNLSAEEWVERWHETVDQEFRAFPQGGYFVQLKAPGLEHYSFSDEVILKAAKDGSKEREEEALRNLRRTEAITRAFLDEVLKNSKQIYLQDDSEMTVKRYGPRR